jgi:ankyrin repeat protein
VVSCSHKGDTVGVQSEIAAGADPSAGDDAGYTPLHIAVQERRSAIVASLLKAGADPNRADKHGNGPLWTAVYWACRRDRTVANVEMIGFLLRAGADPDQKNRVGKSPRDFALEGGDVVVQNLFGGHNAAP